MSEKIDDNEFKGFYNPNVDINVFEGKVSANYNFSASEEEKTAYFNKYGVEYPYKTSTEFRRFVYDYLMWYMDDFVKKANNGDIESLKASSLWRAIDSFIGVFTIVAAAYGLYDAIKCCKKIYEQISVFLTVKLVKETGKLLRKFVVVWEDTIDNFSNPKQDRLVDNKTYSIFNALTEGEEINFKTICTRDYDINHPERAVQTSFLMNDNIMQDIFDLGGHDTIMVEWSGLMDPPLIDGVKLKAEANSNNDLYLQNPLKTVNQLIPLITGDVVGDALITLVNGVDDNNRGFTDIRSKYSIGDGLRLQDDGRTFQLNVNHAHFAPQSVKSYHIKTGSIKKENLTLNSVDGGNIEEGIIEERHLSNRQVFKGGNLYNDSIKARHIPDYSVNGDKILSLSNRNINASISQNVREDICETLNLKDLRDFQGNTDEGSIHFTKESRDMLKKLRLFNNRESEDWEIGIFIDNPGDEYKLSLSNNYFFKFNDNISEIEDKANNISNGLNDDETYYSEVLSGFKHEHNTEAAFFENHWTGGINISKLGSICKLNGRIRVNSNVNVENGVTIARVTSNRFSSYRRICNTFIDTFKKHIFFIAFDNGNIILEKVVDFENKVINELTTLTEFEINLEYIHI